MSSTPRELDCPRRLIALKTFKSERGANDKNSGDYGNINNNNNYNNNNNKHVHCTFYSWIINLHYPNMTRTELCFMTCSLSNG
jgi:hypothetical protein